MLFVIARRNLFRNLRRTLALSLTIALGTGALFCFDGFNAGIMNQYRENTIHARYGYGQINTKGYLDTVYEKPWDHWIDNWPALQRSLDRMEGVESLFPRVSFYSLLTNGYVTVSGMGHGVDGVAESEFFYALNIVEGESLSNQEDGIILGKGLATALGVKPGDMLTILANTIRGSINGLDLIVTGIFHTGSKEFDDTMFRVQLKQAQILLDTDKIENISLGLKGLRFWKPVAAEIKKRYPKLEATSFAILDKVYYQHSVDWLQAQFSIIQLIIVTIVVLGIFNSTSTAILERKQEIGNLRANGESVWDVMKLLGFEGATLGAVASFLGIFFAWLLIETILAQGLTMPPAPGLTRQFEVKIELQTMMALKTFLLGVFASAMATFLAGLRVAWMPVGELLRSV